IRPRPIASWKHTVVLAALFVVLAAGGAWLQRGAAQPRDAAPNPNPVPLYVTLLLAEWGLAVAGGRAARRGSGATPRELVGGRWHGPRDLVVDAALALGLWLVWKLVLPWVSHLLGTGNGVIVQRFLPRGLVAMTLWVTLSMSAGFCEELVFRGYFQRQLEA